MQENSRASVVACDAQYWPNCLYFNIYIGGPLHRASVVACDAQYWPNCLYFNIYIKKERKKNAPTLLVPRTSGDLTPVCTPSPYPWYPECRSRLLKFACRNGPLLPLRITDSVLFSFSPFYQQLKTATLVASFFITCVGCCSG